MRRKAGENGHVVGFVGSFEEELAAGLEYPCDFGENRLRIFEMLENVVRKYQIEGAVLIRNRFPVPYFAFVKKRIGSSELWKGVPTSEVAP